MSFKASSVLVIVLILVGGGWWYRSQQKAEISQETQAMGKPVKADLIQRVTISGVVVPVHSLNVTAPYDGYIRRIFVKIGESIKIGDPLVTISQLAHSKTEELYPISSAINGQVVAITKREGEFVEHSASATSAPSILRVDDLSKLYVDCDVAEMDYPKLKLGQSVVIKAAAVTSRTYQGRIESIAQAAKAQERYDRGRVEFSIRISVVDADAQLRPGMSTMVDVITKELKDVLVLRHEFIWRDSNNKDADSAKNKDAHYYVITASGERKDVTVGDQNDEVFEIKSGITLGTPVKPVDFSSM